MNFHWNTKSIGEKWNKSSERSEQIGIEDIYPINSTLSESRGAVRWIFFFFSARLARQRPWEMINLVTSRWIPLQYTLSLSLSSWLCDERNNKSSASSTTRVLPAGINKKEGERETLADATRLDFSLSLSLSVSLARWKIQYYEPAKFSYPRDFQSRSFARVRSTQVSRLYGSWIEWTFSFFFCESSSAIIKGKSYLCALIPAAAGVASLFTGLNKARQYRLYWDKWLEQVNACI